MHIFFDPWAENATIKKNSEDILGFYIRLLMYSNQKILPTIGLTTKLNDRRNRLKAYQRTDGSEAACVHHLLKPSSCCHG